ncbi:MAG: guanylate kinase [Candidatus Latescibacteria bacterium 4484_181]|nr:MAG: guanylate kinase [Candidatus Latescibacteria bacterium 4484_181]RKY69076.1 MAG: guanylate kinase [Candidatus Latescibacterota bacterium]RKY72848.1 MAG: guanylate kinase [Candidatus Latescibacterota bacterium]
MIVVVSSPSGTGRTTIIERVLREDSRLRYSTSVTTRPQRPGEKEGKDYFFVSEKEFKQRIERGEFVEWAEVHGFMYATPKAPLVEIVQQGGVIILDIDIQGAMQVKEKFPHCVTIFVAPPSLESLEQRLRNRGTDSEELIKRKLQDALRETAKIPEYDYLIVNEDLDTAVRQLQAILEAERCRTKRAQYSITA